MARIIKTSEPLPTDTLGTLAVYNAMDVLALEEIHDNILSQMSPVQRRAYAYEMELQASLLEMELNGIPLDQSKVRRAIETTLEKRGKVEDELHRLAEAIGFYDYYAVINRNRFAEACGVPPECFECMPLTWSEWLERPNKWRRGFKDYVPDKAIKKWKAGLKAAEAPFNARSSDQKLQMFWHFFGSGNNSYVLKHWPEHVAWNFTRGLGELKARNTKGDYVPAGNREALERVIERAEQSGDPRDAAYWARPFAERILRVQDLTKELSVFQARQKDGFFCAAFSASTDTGRLASKKNAQDYGGNAQNVNQFLRDIFTTLPGMKRFASDYGQIESRMVAAIAFVLFGATAYWDIVHCGDAHSLVCSMVWPNLPWPEDFSLAKLQANGGTFPSDLLHAAKKVASKELYRGKTLRDASKTLGHGSNYRGGARQMALHSHIPQKLVEEYQEAYFDACPEIPMWHDWTIRTLQSAGEITTIFGCQRAFHGRPDDSATIRAAIAFQPQSMGAYYTNEALIRIMRGYLKGEFPIRLELQKHDEISAEYDPASEDEILRKLAGYMEHPKRLVSPTGEERTLVVPVEHEVGWNLRPVGRDGSNPNGLVEHPDSRPGPVKEVIAIEDIEL